MAFSAAKQKPQASFGNLTAMTFKVTHDNSTAYFDTGLSHVWWASEVSQTATNGIDQIVFNSNDGTEGTAAGYVYFTAEGDGDVTYFLVIGW